MSLLSGFEFLSVLLVVGILFLLSVRMKAWSRNVFFIVIITVLILGLIYMSKITYALLGFILLLISTIAILALVRFGRPSVVEDTRKSRNHDAP